MVSATMVWGGPVRRNEAWRLYRIRTANSTYELEVQESGVDRRCTILTKLDPHDGVLQSFEDSAPRVGTQSLYDVSPLDWIGRRLAVGTVCTSELVSVDFLTTSTTRAARHRAPRAQPASPPPAAPPPWAPFPLGNVEMLEAAASVLGAIAHRHDLLAALQQNPKLARRYQLALAQCGLLMETLLARSND